MQANETNHLNVLDTCQNAFSKQRLINENTSFSGKTAHIIKEFLRTEIFFFVFFFLFCFFQPPVARAVVNFTALKFIAFAKTNSSQRMKRTRKTKKTIARKLRDSAFCWIRRMAAGDIPLYCTRIGWEKKYKRSHQQNRPQ